MIGMLTGKVKDVLEDEIILDVNGVGYSVKISTGEVLEGDSIELYIHTSVRENDISLWGFKSSDELNVFRKLLAVSGVGLKTALAIVSEKGVSGVVNAVRIQDSSMLKVPGVGKKIAERIILDLEGKIDGIMVTESAGTPRARSMMNINSEVIEALMSLGYKQRDIEEAIKSIPKDELEEMETSQIIKTILRNI